MPIFASDTLLHENQKKSSNKVLPQWVLNPWPLIPSPTLSFLYKYGMCYLNFCSCTTWFLDFNDLFKINRAWLYKELEISVLQANVELVQKGEWWTCNQRLIIGLGSKLTGWGNILPLDLFCFYIVKALMPILALLRIFVCLWKTR